MIRDFMSVWKNLSPATILFFFFFFFFGWQKVLTLSCRERSLLSISVVSVYFMFWNTPGWKKKRFVRGYRGWIPHLRFDGNTRKEPVAKPNFHSEFQDQNISFVFHCIPVIARVKFGSRGPVVLSRNGKKVSESFDARVPTATLWFWILICRCLYYVMFILWIMLTVSFIIWLMLLW